MKKCLIAATLTVCMITDLAVAPVLWGDFSEGPEALTVITEEHELEPAYADGIFDGENSSGENKNDDIVESAEGKSLFNILEILPTERKAVVGFSIGGCEPFEQAKGLKRGEEYIVTPQQMRQAYMDALINKQPGSSDAKSWDINSDIGTINSKMKEGGSLSPFTIEGVDAVGYYKYVGGEYGVFAKGSKNGSDQVMYSKFYNYSSSRDYAYIFVYSDAPSTGPRDINVTGHKRLKYTNNEKFVRDVIGKSTDAEVQEWKNSHVLEVVTRTPLSVTMGEIERADLIIVNNGSNMDYYQNALKVNNRAHLENESTDNSKVFGNPSGNSNNVDFDTFEKVIKIYERVAIRQDVAFVASRNCMNGTTFDTNMRKLMCMLYFVDNINEKDEYGNVLPGSGRDLFMNYMRRYVDRPGKEYMELRNQYELHKNEAESVSKLYPDYRAPSLRHDDYYNGIPYMHYHPLRDPGHPLVRDISKAITGGHYDENGILVPENDQSKVKEVKIRRRYEYYFRDAGIPKKSWNNPDGYDNDGDSEHPWYINGYMSMSNATDYAYIDETNGDFVVTDQYASNNNQYWYQIDEDDGNNWHAYKRITWNARTWSDKWPWDIVEGGCLKYWFFDRSVTNDSGNLHLRYDYFKWGPYRARDGVNGGTGFRNQTLESENELFKGNSSLIKRAVSGRPVKRETDDPNHIEEKTKKDYYISMNILNGDGANVKNPTVIDSKNIDYNKTLYFNEYELDIPNGIIAKENASGTPKKSVIPINIRLKSSCKIKEITVTDNHGDLDLLYSFESDVGNDKMSFETTGYDQSHGRSVNKLTLTRTPGSYDTTNGMPVDKDGNYDTTGQGNLKYSFDGQILDVLSDYYKTHRNTKITVEMSAYAPDGSIKKVKDTITIVKRDFFMLD
ncbi:MAG: hypothetical protein IKO16_04260 [Lachnospiraceae bacterium]|nr:hypothetical protein [Lachnospiraceae bacterium]